MNNQILTPVTSSVTSASMSRSVANARAICPDALRYQIVKIILSDDTEVVARIPAKVAMGGGSMHRPAGQDLMLCFARSVWRSSWSERHLWVKRVCYNVSHDDHGRMSISPIY